MAFHFERTVLCRITATASALIVGVISLRLYRDYLTPEIYGAVLIALQIINYLRFLDGGFRSAINRRLLTEFDDVRKSELTHFGQVFYSWLATGLLLVGMLCMTIYSFTPSAEPSGQSLPFFLILGATGAITVISSAQMSLLIGLHAQAKLFLLSAMYSWITLLALWVSLRAGAGVIAFPVSSLVGVGSIYPLLLISLAKLMPGIRFVAFRVDERFWKEFNALKRDAWLCLRSEISMMLLFTMDVIIVGVICGPDSAAVYGVLARLFGIVLSFLLASSEAAWPFIAQGGPKQDLAHVLLRANAWIQSAVMGAMFVTLSPFLKWFMGEIWTASNPVFVLVAIRFFIMGLAGPANYALFGMGAFQMMARYFERELIAGCILSILLGLRFGLVGVAWGFLLATGFGTLLPVYRGFTNISQSPLVGTMFHIWSRACAGGAISCLTASTLLHIYSAEGVQTVYIGGIAALATIAIAVIVSCLRIRFSPTNSAKHMTLRDIGRNM